MSSKQISMLEREVHLRSFLSSIPDAVIAAPFDHDVHHRGFWPKQLMAVWSLLLQSGSEGSSFIFRTARRRRTGVFMTQCQQLPWADATKECLPQVVRGT